MDIREIAKELAVACLSHRDVAVLVSPRSTDAAQAKDAGQRLGEFYNSIYETLLKQALASSNPTN